jgi:hypothetical protein
MDAILPSTQLPLFISQALSLILKPLHFSYVKEVMLRVLAERDSIERRG